MAFSLREVVPWGRSFAEYVAMFTLGDDDLGKRILGCGDGPASFNATLTGRGGSVVSIDPIYRFTTEEIAGRIEETYPLIMEQTRQNEDEFVWSSICSVEELGKVRNEAMSGFLADYERGKRERRYLESQLPQLPFSDRSFDLALCSHFLFLYSEHFDEAFHLQSLRELCRVADEVRVFPLLELGCKRSRHLAPLVAKLTAEEYQVSTERVDYEFQRGGNEMLKVRRPMCESGPAAR